MAKAKKAKNVKIKAATSACDKEKKLIKDASAAVAQILAHFGAGYAAQQLSEDPSKGLPDAQMFPAPADLGNFHSLLLDSTIRNWAKLNWLTDDAMRDTVCSTAFKHGALARETALAYAAIGPDFDIILSTFRQIKDEYCPSGSGGGPACEF